MQKSKAKNTGTPIRLKDLKAPLQAEATKLDRSLNWVVVEWMKEHPCVKEYLKQKSERSI